MEYSNKIIDTEINKYNDAYNVFENNISEGIILYGAGFVGTWAAKYLTSIGVTVKYFIDADEKKIGQHLLDIEIIKPDDERIAECPYILIAARHAVNQVMEYYSNTSYVAMAFEAYYVIKNRDEYFEVRDNFLEDEESVETYNALLYSMLSGSIESCRKVMIKDMYFALPEFSGTCGNEIFVDAGAFVGDSIEKFVWENLGTFRHIYAFEPGKIQFNALKKRMNRLYEEWGIDESKVSLIQGGLSNKSIHMSCIYTDDHPLRHALSDHVDNSEENVLSYALDEYLNGDEITFLKADVEGMEMELLEGAKNTINKYKPKMAICAYHYPCDLYCIAKYIKQIRSDYKFKLRLHAPFFGDFVLYCY